MYKGQRILSITLFISLSFFCSVKKSITGIYSSFEYSNNSGDIIGMEAYIVPNPNGFSIIIQASEGAPAFPEIFNLLVSEDLITFEIPNNSACGLLPGIYSGIIEENSLYLKSPNKTMFYLKRGKSFWQD